MLIIIQRAIITNNFLLQMRTEGVSAFSKGFGPAMIRAFPANAVS